MCRRLLLGFRKASFIRFITSWSGLISFPHLQTSVQTNTYCRHDVHWIEDFLNSISLHIAKTARLDSLLNTIFSLAKSSRIQISFEPSFTRSISWVYSSLFENASVMNSCSLTRVPTSTFETVRMLFPVATSTSVTFFRFVSHSCFAFPVACSFPLLFTPSLRVVCCGCWCFCVSQLLLT